MRWRVVVWAGVGVAAVAAVGLGVFWKIKGLEEAGWLAGVLSGFAALVSLAIFLYDRLPSRSGPQPSEPEPAGRPAGAGTVNTFKDATNVGPVVMGRDISGPVTSLPSAFPAQAGDRQPQEHNRPGPTEGEHGAERPGSAEAPSGG